MAFKFKKLRLPFVRVSDGKSGRSVTWKVGAWSYNTRTGKQTLKLGKNARWESKPRPAKAKAKGTKGRYTAAQAEQIAVKARRDADRKTQQQEWRRKIAAGEVEGLKVPADVRARTTRTRSGGTQTARQQPRRGRGNDTGIVHEVSPEMRAFMDEQKAKKAARNRWWAEEETRQFKAIANQGLSREETAERMIGARNFLGQLRQLEELRERAGQTWEEKTGRRSTPATPDAPTQESPAGAGGLCGAPTQDGTPCRNAKGGCPHPSHRNGQGAARPAGRARRRS